MKKNAGERKMKTNQKGFGLLYILLSLLLVGAVATTGWFIYKKTSPAKNMQTDNKFTPNNTITSFIKSQNLLDAKTDEIRIEDFVEDTKLFEVQYGKPQDCPSGCFYSSATGMSFNDKIGWLTIDDYDNAINFKTAPYYDFSDKDAPLFSGDFSRQLLEKDEYAYRGFVQLLARDKDTPLSTLTKITSELGSSLIGDSCLVRSLAKNDTLKNDNDSYKKIQSLYKKSLEDKYVVEVLYNAGHCDEI